MAYILHIDTSGDTGITAISKGGALLSQAANTEARNHAAVINGHIDQVLKEAGIALKDLSGIAVCGGPGSYTGLRIGLSTAKGLCYILDIPLMMHHRLLLLVAKHTGEAVEHERIISALKARDKEYFIAAYDNALNTVIEPQHTLEEDLAELLRSDEKTLVTGYTDDLILDIADQNGWHVLTEMTIDITRWAAYAFDEYNCNGFVSLASAEPFYLKQVYTHKSNKTN